MFRSNMRDALEEGRLFVFRNSTMSGITYRYFTKSRDQFKKFVHEREEGTTEGPNKRYHVYVDEDVDTEDHEYRKLFRPSREL